MQRWRRVRRVAAVGYIVLNAIYMVYRFTIINPHSLLLSWSYFVAESFQFVLGLTYIFMSWQFRRRTSLPPLPGATVEVWVPVYREPLDVIRRTLAAANRIDYPHETRVFDDGRRPEVKAIAEELGVAYFSRPENIDAKAGNLNFALSQSCAEFIMVFDADHIALPSALDGLLGYFADETVALVQSPQDYYNTDAFQYFNAKRRGGIWHDQSFFYLFGLPSMDRDNSASCVGTGVVYRRSALAEIGGIPTDTATEDIHTSLRLMKHGWKTVFHNDPVAYGIAAANLEEYYKTRHRWAHGNLHVLSLERVPFTKGLTFRQRLHHLSLGLIYLEGWQQLLLLLIPVVALLTGWQPFVITPLNVLIVLFYPLVSILLLQELGSGYSRIWANEIFSMARWPVHIISVLGVFRRKILWKTSSKLLQTQTTISRVLPQLVIFLLSAIGLGVAIAKLIAHFDSGILLSGQVSDMTKPLEQGYTVDILVVAGGWALYNMIRVGVFLKRAWHVSDSSDEHNRFTLQLPMCCEGVAGQTWVATTWISETALAFVTRELVAAGSRIRCALPLPTGTVDATLHVTRTHTRRDGTTEVECILSTDGEHSQQRLIDALYSVYWYRDLRTNRPIFRTPLQWLAGLFRSTSLRRYRVLDRFATLRSNDGEFVFAIVHDEEASALLTTYQALMIGAQYTLHRTDSTTQEIIHIRIMSEDCSEWHHRIGEEGNSSHRYLFELASPMQ